MPRTILSFWCSAATLSLADKEKRAIWFQSVPGVLGLVYLEVLEDQEMMRTILLLAATLAIALSPPLESVARAQQKHAEHFAKCAKVCADCQLECDACTKHCMTLTAEGKKQHAKMAQLCADCGDCCKLCSALCAREGPLSRYMLECCVKCCDDCAAGCGKFPDDRRMAACAKLCQDCAKECRAMIKAFDQ